MKLVQFENPGQGRRLGVVQGESVADLTSVQTQWQRVSDVFDAADRADCTMAELLAPLAEYAGITRIDYATLHSADALSGQPFLHPPVDLADPHRVLVTGTGLTHLGSMQSRNQMHAQAEAESEENLTDSKRMFQMGLEGGKPQPGQRGTSPEWFYKGNGAVLRGHRQPLALPSYALDGGEEAELVGCYMIDRQGVPRRLGFALGNEWSDHATEKINYLYLAPSKLRTCAVGPELITDFDFQEVKLRCSVQRGGEVIYDSGELLSGEQHMCHTLANCEDHHFKYAQHRQSGDMHLHYFGTSKLSHSSRDWKFADGDEITIEAPGLSAPLVNLVTAEAGDARQPVSVEPV